MKASEKGDARANAPFNHNDESVYALAEQLRLNAMRLVDPERRPRVREVLGELMDILTGRKPWDLDAHVTPEERRQVEGMRKALLDDVVFVVFNFTPLRRPELRVFVAAINWPNIDDTIKEVAQHWQVSRPLAQEGSECDVVVFAGTDALSDVQTRCLQNLWKEQWEDYRELTRSGMVHQRYTWNQFLLKAARHPRALGVFLGNLADYRSVPDFYARLDMTDLKAIGIELGPKHAADSLEILHLLERDFRSPEHMTRGLEEAIHLWERCAPIRMSAPALRDVVPWSIFHLIRCYLFWGGNSFLSIPTTFGATAEDHTAVLSIASVRPLNERAVTRWQNVATHVFNALLAQEAIAMEAAAERVAVYEALGHTLKSAVRVTGWYAMRDDLRRLARNVPQAALTHDQSERLLRNLHRDPDSPSRTVQDVLRQATDTLATFALAESLGGLVRLISVVETGNWDKIDSWIDDESLERWLRSDETLLDEYAKTILAVAKMTCKAQGWPRLRLETRGALSDAAPTVVEWKRGADTDDDFQPVNLQMPPLRRNTDAAFALLPAILEPLINAARESAQDPSRDFETPITIRLGAQLPDFIRLEVGNPVSIPFRGALPKGLTDTAILVEKIDIARFANRVVCEELASDRYMIWVTLDLTPHLLATRIQKQRAGKRP